MKKIKQETLNKTLDCIARAVHPNYSYIEVNQLINELSKLPEEKVKKKE